MKKASMFSKAARGSAPYAVQASRKERVVRLARIPALLTGILLFIGFALPAKAGTCHVTLDKNNTQGNGDCANVLSGAGTWVFTYTVTGKVTSFGRHIKNNPGAGDICWQSSIRKPKSGGDTAPGIPAASQDVCGDEFTDTNGDPLTLSAFIQGGTDAKVDITVDYPDPLP